MRHNWPILHHASTLLGLAMRLVPYRYRFTAARWLAMILHPLIARTAMCRAQVAMGLDTSREVTLYVVLRFLTRVGCTFEVEVSEEGQFERGEGGVLIAMAHTTLCYGMFRRLADAGHDPVVLEAAANLLLGSPQFPRWAHCGPSRLRRCGGHLAGGDVLTAMLDRDAPCERTVTMDLPARPLHVGTPLLDIAQNVSATTWFCSARADKRFNITLAWERAGADPLPQFKRFLQRELPSARAIRRGHELPGGQSGSRWQRGLRRPAWSRLWGWQRSAEARSALSPR